MKEARIIKMDGQRVSLKRILMIWLLPLAVVALTLAWIGSADNCKWVSYQATTRTFGIATASGRVVVYVGDVRVAPSGPIEEAGWASGSMRQSAWNRLIDMPTYGWEAIGLVKYMARIPVKPFSGAFGTGADATAAVL